MRKLALAITAAITLICSPAAAQDGWGWSIIIPSVTGTDQLGQHLREQTSRAPPPAAPRVQPTTAALRFVPSADRRKANFARFVSQRRKVDPAAAKELETLLADPQVMPSIDRQLRARGLRSDNMADAYAAWWIQAWQTAHGQTADPSPAAIRAVKAQSEQAFLASPALLAMDDGAKQEFSEGLLLQAVILGSALEQVAKDPGQLRTLAQIARSGARQSGLDLDAMTLTDQGFTAVAG